MLNLGPSGPPFAPYEGQEASKLDRSRNEGIPEPTFPSFRVSCDSRNVMALSPNSLAWREGGAAHELRSS